MAVDRFVGVLESPLENAGPVIGEHLSVRGWALAPGGIRRMRARCGDVMSDALAIDQPRPDLADDPSWPQAALGGFAGRLDVGRLPAGEHLLTVTAYGRESLLHAWQRMVRICDDGEAYRTWREALLAGAEDVLRRRPAGVEASATAIAWLVRRHADTASDALAATFASLAEPGAGSGEVRVVEDDDAASVRRACERVAAPYVGWMAAGDRLAPGAAALLRSRLAAESRPDLVYFDHDHQDPQGRPSDPVLKPGWSKRLAMHPDVARGAWVIRRDLLCGEWPAGAAESIGPGDALGASAGGRTEDVLASALGRCESVVHLPLALMSIRRALPLPTPACPPEAVVPASARASVIVPTCMADRAMLARCLDGVFRATEGPAPEVVVVLNNLRGFDAIQARAFLAPWGPKVVHDDRHGFNWSLLCNAGARIASGDLLVFLNDDVVPSRPDWLRAMSALGAQPRVGAVGAVLRYPDGRLQHAGISIRCGMPLDCRHVFRDCTGREPRIARWLARDRTQTAVTGACLLTPRDAFWHAGGFDEGLPVAFNDIDYCLRLKHRLGLETVVAAAAELVHHEGASRAGLAEAADYAAFCDRWAAASASIDPYGHPLLARDRDDWTFDLRSRFGGDPRVDLQVSA